MAPRSARRYIIVRKWIGREPSFWNGKNFETTVYWLAQTEPNKEHMIRQARLLLPPKESNSRFVLEVHAIDPPFGGVFRHNLMWSSVDPKPHKGAGTPRPRYRKTGAGRHF